MDKATVKTIQEHACIARDVWQSHLEKTKDARCFHRYFHLRPTSNGVTIVTTLPYAPMRGVKIPADTHVIANKLDQIESRLPVLISETSDHKECLLELGFARRGKRKLLEEDIQARFIRGMIDGEPAYQGIRFVTSELTLGENKRFDVVGVKECTLYLFELKKNRTVSAAPQVRAYCDLVRSNWEAFDRVLSVYPNNTAGGFESVKGIAVMCFSDNSTLQSWEDWRDAAQKLEMSPKCNPDISGIDIWLLRDSLSFQKLSAKIDE